MPGTETDKVIAPIFGISRLRMGTDGSGVTTLVTFLDDEKIEEHQPEPYLSQEALDRI